MSGRTRAVLAPATLGRISKTAKPTGSRNECLETLDERARRLLAIEAEQEGLEIPVKPFDLDDDAGRRVGDPSGEAELLRQPEDKRAEPDALHGAANDCSHPFTFRHVFRAPANPSRSAGLQ